MLTSFGATYPAGLFMPTILSGCCLGGAIGNLMEPIAGKAPFSLMGAVALLGGIQRSPISLCVVILEGTGQVHWLLPIILTTVVARWVGDKFGPSIYHAAMHLKSVPFLEAEHGNLQEDWLCAHTAGEVSTKGPIVSLRPKEQVRMIVQKLVGNAHCGFPVVNEAAAGPLQFSGLVLREQLASVLRNKAWESNQDLLMFNRVSLAHSEAKQHIADDINLAASFVTPQVSSQQREAIEEDLLRELDVGHHEMDMWVDIEAVMNPCPLTVMEGCPLPRVIQLFCSMGLRHLPVVDANSQVVGMITRKDLHTGIPLLKQQLEQPSADTPRWISRHKDRYNDQGGWDSDNQKLLQEDAQEYAPMRENQTTSQLPPGGRDSLL